MPATCRDAVKRHFGKGIVPDGVGQEPGDGRAAEPGPDSRRLRHADGRAVPRPGAGLADAGLRRAAHGRADSWAGW